MRLMTALINELNSLFCMSGSVTSVPDDITSTSECSPCQPAGMKFSVTYFSSKERSFNSDCFQQYVVIE